MWKRAMLLRRTQGLMSVPERLRILTQSAFWEIAGPLYIPYLMLIHDDSIEKHNSIWKQNVQLYTDEF